MPSAAGRRISAIARVFAGISAITPASSKHPAKRNSHFPARGTSPSAIPAQRDKQIRSILRILTPLFYNGLFD